MNRVPSTQLPAHTALRALPELHGMVADDLAYQTALALPHRTGWCDRTALLAALEAAIVAAPGGLICVEGPSGSGVTSALLALAAGGSRPIWLEAVRAPLGITAFCAQIAAVCPHLLPLIDPAVITDSAALERFLALAAKESADRLVLLVDLGSLLPTPQGPLAPPLPHVLPPSVTLVVGCEPGMPLPMQPAARFRLPEADPDHRQLIEHVAARLPLSSDGQAALVDAAEGMPLYPLLAGGLFAAGDAHHLPVGIAGLIDHWWDGLTEPGQRLALLLAVAGAPVPLDLLDRLVEFDTALIMAHWEELGLINLTMQRSSGDGNPPMMMAAYSHGAIAQHLVLRHPVEVTAAHQVMVTAVQGVALRSGGGPVELYLLGQYGRHVAGAGDPAWEQSAHALLASDWVRMRERYDGAIAAYQDSAWALRCAGSYGTALQLAIATAQAGTFATLARSLSADAAVAALLVGMERGGRESSLRQVLDLVDRLPDGSDKAQILRRLGETCYANRMRSSAMRLLSRAIDLEAQPISRAWRDQREQLLAALALAALGHDDVDSALVITEQIEHLERRAQVETQVARWLLAKNDRDRAQRVARAILHESMGLWAQAEVGVALCRAGDPRGPMMLHELSSETVVSWAQIELACDAAATDENAALARVMALPSQNQRDRGLARLSHTLACLQKDGDALAAAEAIQAVEVRVAALIDLRLNLDGLVAMLALERATSDIAGVSGDDHAPLLAALAAALAALGRADRALQLLELLEAGEERNRGLARVAVSLAYGGERAEANRVLALIDDDDERDWARDEIARQFGSAGYWDEALAQVGEVLSDEQRGRTLADLAIARARAGHALPALGMALGIGIAHERTRALTLIVPALVAEGQVEAAMRIVDQPEVIDNPDGHSRYLATLAITLAEIGHCEQAMQVAAQTLRALDRARAEIAIAAAYLATGDQTTAHLALGRAFRSAVVGREEAYRALELAAPTLAACGGTPLLRNLATTLALIDRR